ncbi:peptidylprolyl isomerase [Sphingomicrobium lutaoense]|uniref:peptidylprolyl isomerase n=1 Tax=Sphingomicrobium lutaoense TaxID=515949 RepID=A0A839Z0W4_9SPHN|nr:peptidylprolyl isomerase [Sphingomicrobium lutaoense]MBB3764979.1 peptidyl-prolyl cis-trans isomerase A (cyclophilin A) [Sphingomicrobium lutaoense]
MLTLALAAFALQAAEPQAMPLPPAAGEEPVPEMIVEEDLVHVTLETEMGPILLALDRGRAPVTVANFLAYVDRGWLDGQPFYRAMPWGDGGLIQGGVRDGAKLLDPIEHEPTSRTGLSNVRGAIGMANAGPGTARNDFFILTTDIAAFDAKENSPGFAPFGMVVEGMDVVEAILAAPVDPDKGEGAMKGQMLAKPVRILEAERSED